MQKPTRILTVEGRRAGKITQSLEQQAETAVRQHALAAGVTLTEAQLQRGVRQVVAATMRKARSGQPSRAQQRALRQIKAGTLKGPHVTDDARMTALGLRPASDLSIIAEPGETA